jgi:predicted DNA-binding antitoxin AbrB/MazE fold protein
MLKDKIKKKINFNEGTKKKIIKRIRVKKSND